MTVSFAYSFDQETFHGRYPTREAALAAAARALRDRADQPEGIFVGQWVVPDPQTDGHAAAVVDAMRDRWRRAGGDRDYLAGVTEAGEADLDAAIRDAIADWMSRHRLTPTPTRVQAVSHHPVPNVHHVAEPARERETSLIGEA